MRVKEEIRFIKNKMNRLLMKIARKNVREIAIKKNIIHKIQEKKKKSLERHRIIRIDREDIKRNPVT